VAQPGGEDDAAAAHGVGHHVQEDAVQVHVLRAPVRHRGARVPPPGRVCPVLLATS
jgi:hypothetical protein